MVRSIALASAIILAMAGASAHAQEARVKVFGPVSDGTIEQANGTVQRASSGFTLYEMNQWKPVAQQTLRSAEIAHTMAAPVPVQPSVPDAVEASMMQALIQMQGPGVQSARAIPSSPMAGFDICRSVAPLPMAGLSLKAKVARQLYWPIVRDAECRYRLPTGLLDSVVITESRYQVGAISPVGAAGLAQLMPGTARQLGVTNRFNPTANIDGGARYLRGLLDDFRSVPLAVAAYNAGPGAVRRHGRIPMNRETPTYVGRVLGYWQVHTANAGQPISARGLAQVLGFSPL